MRNLLRAALCAAILAGAAGPSFAAPKGDDGANEPGPAEGAAVTKFCVSEPGFFVTLLFVIRTHEDLKRCKDEGYHTMGVWDLQFFLHLPPQLPKFPGPDHPPRGPK